MIHENKLSTNDAMLMFISVIAANFSIELKLDFLLFIRYVSIILVLNSVVQLVYMNEQTLCYEV